MVAPLLGATAPNVILIMADDLGWGDVGFNGNTVIHTPHLDDMAAHGLTFKRFYAAAPVCSPTRGSVLTGRHPSRYGILHANVGHLPPREVTLAEVLHDHGYRTGHFGKWHLGTLTKTEKDSNRGGPAGIRHYSVPARNGFDVSFSTEAKVPTWDPMIQPAKRPAGNRWWDPVTQPADARSYGTAYWDQQGRKTGDNLQGDDSRVIMDRVLPFIRDSVAARKPFLAVIWFHAPHLPVVAGSKYTSRYKEHDKYAQHYYGCITAMDEQIGRLRALLRDLKQASNTMVWFCSDNGPEGRAGKAPGSAGPFRGRKRDLFEGGIRVPGLLEWPGRVKAGTVTSFPAVTSDYFPTILGRLDIDLPKGRLIDGIDLWPAIEGRQKTRTIPIHFRHGNTQAVMEHRYKLVITRRPMLFDLVNDPGETRDIAGERPEVVVRMKALRMASDE